MGAYAAMVDERYLFLIIHNRIIIGNNYFKRIPSAAHKGWHLHL